LSDVELEHCERALDRQRADRASRDAGTQRHHFSSRETDRQGHHLRTNPHSSYACG
jgi:hypothetical protein